MFASLSGFSWGTIIGDILAGLVLVGIAFGRKQIRDELIIPVKKLSRKFKKHIKDYRKFKDDTRSSLFVLQGKLQQYEASNNRIRTGATKNPPEET